MIKYTNNYKYHNCYVQEKLKQMLTINLMYNYVDFIIKYIQDTGEALNGLTSLKWSCDVRWDHL